MDTVYLNIRNKFHQRIYSNQILLENMKSRLAYTYYKINKDMNKTIIEKH